MNLDPVRNFVTVFVSTGYASGITTVVLSAGEGAKLPDPASEGAFNLVWYDYTTYANPASDPDVEIVRCTARSTDTLTITRAQEGTSDVNHNTGGKTYRMIVAITKKTIDDIRGAKLDSLVAPDDNTTLDASTTKHGLMPKIASPTQFNWVLVPAANYTATPASTSTITMGVDMTASILVGMGLRYTIGGTEYFGRVSAIASNLLTVNGAPLGGDVSNLKYGRFISQVVYDNSKSVSVLTTGTVYTLRWDKPKAYLVLYRAYQTIHDTGTHGKVTVYINGTEVNTSAGGLTIAADATWYSTVVDIATAAYDVNPGEDVTIVVTQGSNVNGYGLKVNMIFVVP